MSDELPLAAEFPSASREDWLKLVSTALKDRPFERLIAKTYDGIPIEPLYGRATDATPVAGRNGPWQVMARIDHPDPALANAEALHELENGATGLSLVFAGSIGAYGFGLPGDAKSIARALDGVQLDAITIELHTAEQTKDAADHVAALAKSRGHDPAKLDIHFGHDAIGAHTLTGSLPLPLKDLLPRFGGHVAGLAQQGFKSPLAVADGRIAHNAGGSEAQELAYTIAVAVSYLRALESAGIALDAARGLIEFRLAADGDQFLTIAKFRALRKLWARVEDACGLKPKPAYVSAETAWRMMTKWDSNVNMLRTTIAVFAAGVGGANAITALPFTAALGLPDRFARRVARNTQLLLLEESNIAKVSDPMAGAGGIEDLTEKLCRAAWTEFQKIESAGGLPAALEAGSVQSSIAAVRSEREAAVARRKDTLTGTSDYPLISETLATVLDVPPRPDVTAPAKIAFPALPRIRLAEPFERLREASDRVLAKTGARPKVFLANLGSVADFTARATFAKNFFEAGGIEAVTNDGFKSQEEMIAACKASGAKLACLCSSDEVYETSAAGAAMALKASGVDVVLAGRPKEQDALKAAGIELFIFAGGDVLGTLKSVHGMLGLTAGAER